MADELKLGGQLEEFRLVELLQAMGLGASTGALHLRQADGRTGLIYFEQGALVSCIELDTEALTLGHVLQQLDLVSAAMIEEAYEMQVRDPLGKRIGERLVEMGSLTPEDLQRALRTQTVWTARELALWRHGSYEFHAGERLPSDAVSMHIEHSQVTLEVLRYEHEWETLHPFLPDGMRTRVAMVYDPPAGHPLLFHTTAWRVISHVNSCGTVRRIATALHLPEVDVARMVGPLVQEGLLTPLGPVGGPGLPAETERLSMDHFELFTLLISMHQEWLKRKNPADRLAALASFINQTMDALQQACDARGLALADDTLATLLARQGLLGVDSYQFRIDRNHIDVEHFAAFCKRVMDSTAHASVSKAGQFYASVLEDLLMALGAAFSAINARVAYPVERLQNQEAWETLFMTLRGMEEEAR